MFHQNFFKSGVVLTEVLQGISNDKQHQMVKDYLDNDRDFDVIKKHYPLKTRCLLLH
ncbi:MAG: Unknown protein [uncultured Thiotrichaceae bacterium]|uniref:Uncharacterized protein n=1 Tax=uncultured Thiotrichaceae bacterium TaxID=298394 RepID=A0A6S6TZQ4_9GAMM|nr:MAG: Unknown protein [uncultured Thiotrichaceae bacterium]